MRRLLAMPAVLVALVLAAPASAADSVWWTNYGADTISSAPLAGGSVSDLAAPGGPRGGAVDTATGKLYRANFGNNTIAVSNLDGSGSTLLNTAGATVSNPTGLAIDPGAGRVYWMNGNANKVSWAAVDGSGGGDLTTTGAPMSLPEGVAVYPAKGRIYWANNALDSIAYANLDGSGGGEVPVPSADLENPSGVAIDGATNTIYWTNYGNGTIGYASLAGLGVGLLPITGTTTQHPTGVAIDPEARPEFAAPEARIYWADEVGGGVYSAPLAGGSAVRLDSGAATEPAYPFLFEAPQAIYTAVPAILLIARPGQTLTCGTTDRWKPDLPESGLFRAPQSVAIQWTLGGVPIPGANGPTYTASAEGTLSCHVLATNGAGTTDGAGGTWAVRAAPEEQHPRPLLEVLKVKRSRKAGTATIVSRVSGPGTATLTGKQVVRRSVRSSGSGVVKVQVAAKGKALRRLRKTGKVKVAIKLGFRATEGADIFISRAITLSRGIHR